MLCDREVFEVGAYLRLGLVALQALTDNLELRHPHCELGFAHDCQAVLGEPRRVGYRSTREMSDGDVFKDDRGFLPVRFGQPFEHRARQILRLVKPADLRVGGDAIRVESVLIKEPCPDSIFLWVSNAERFCCLTP